jgi:hypothetical protein
VKASPEIVVTDAGRAIERSDVDRSKAKSRMRDSHEPGSKRKSMKADRQQQLEPRISISRLRIPVDEEPKYETNRTPLKSTIQSPVILRFTFPLARAETEAGIIVNLSCEQ